MENIPTRLEVMAELDQRLNPDLSFEDAKKRAEIMDVYLEQVGNREPSDEEKAAVQNQLTAVTEGEA